MLHRRGCPATDIAAQSTRADYNDTDALRAFTGQVDTVTSEFENVPAAAMALIAGQRLSAPASPRLKQPSTVLPKKTSPAALALPHLNLLRSRVPVISQHILRACRTGRFSKPAASDMMARGRHRLMRPLMPLMPLLALAVMIAFLKKRSLLPPSQLSVARH